MDIVERLRREEDALDNEAADEIERLRKENAVLLHSADDVYKRLMPEVDRLREALKETLAVARRNEIGDYIQRAETALQQKESE